MKKIVLISRGPGGLFGSNLIKEFNCVESVSACMQRRCCGCRILCVICNGSL